MALSNYTELQAAIAAWSDRDDTTAIIPDFIALAESKMNSAIRSRRNTATATVSVASTGIGTLPTGCQGVRTARLVDSPYNDLESVSLDRLGELLGRTSPGGSAAAFAVRGDDLVIWPAPSAATDVTVTYYTAIPALADNATNWVLTSFPDAYLYGSLAQAWSYHANAQEAASSEARFRAALSDINIAHGFNTYGDSAAMLMESATP